MATDWGNAKRIEEIKNKLRAFNRKEFQDLLFKCHSILRDVHKNGARTRIRHDLEGSVREDVRGNARACTATFTVDYLDLRDSTRLPTDLLVHDGLFEQTKNYYKADDLFALTDRLEISEETFRRIVKELERFRSLEGPATTSRDLPSRSSLAPRSVASSASSSRPALSWTSWST